MVSKTHIALMKEIAEISDCPWNQTEFTELPINCLIPRMDYFQKEQSPTSIPRAICLMSEALQVRLQTEGLAQEKGYHPCPK